MDNQKPHKSNNILKFAKRTEVILFLLSSFISFFLSLFQLSISFPSIIVVTHFFFTIASGTLFILSLSYLLKSRTLIDLREVLLNISFASLIFIPIFFPVLVAMILFVFLHGRLPVTGVENILFLSPFVAIAGYLWIYSKFSKSMQDVEKTNIHEIKNKKHSVLAMFIIAVSITGFSLFYKMSFFKEWLSGIFGVYNFTGSVQATLAGVYLILIFNQNKSFSLTIPSENHFKYIGTLIFVFTLLHAYTSYFQYIIIYSANIPNEFEWFKAWKDSPLFYTATFIITGRFILPFIFFLFNNLKNKYKYASIVCELIILSHFCEILLNTFSSQMSQHISIIFTSVGLLILNVLFFILIYTNISKKYCASLNKEVVNKGLATHS